MSIMSSRIIRHKLIVKELREMGAKVLELQGVQVLIKFNFDGFLITYSYTINSDNTYFLERLKPYTLAVGDFEEEEQILDIIKEDIDQFKNAMKSSNFDKFITINNHLTQLVRIFEDLYLYYNISKDDVLKLDSSVDSVLEEVREVFKRSTRAYTKKDPDVLNENIEFID